MIQHNANGMTTTQNFPTRKIKTAVTEIGLRLCDKRPVLRRTEKVGEAERDVEIKRVWHLTCLEEKDGGIGRGGETIGENAAGCTTTDDNIVVGCGFEMGRNRAGEWSD